MLKPFLDTMLQSVDERVEIVICDNGSTDESRAMLVEYGEKWGDMVKIVLAEKNLGFAGGSNLAYENASGKYIIFMNNDVRAVHNNWVDIFLSQAAPNKVLGPHLVESNDLTEVLDYGPVKYLNGWCMFFPREILEEIGVFDEGVGLAFFEDVELSYRAVKAGYILEQVNDTGLQHLGSQTLSDGFRIDEITDQAQKHYRSKMIQYKREENGNLRIVFIVPSNYKFNDYDWEGRGVGGAEASLINLSRALARAGHEVWVYNECDKQGVFNGVHWAHISTFQITDYADVAIIFRMPIENIRIINAKIKLFWSCDQYTTGKWDKEILPYVDRMVAISPYHQWYLAKHKNIHPDFVKVIDLGISKQDYEVPGDKVPGKMIFCSVPDRGLNNMRDIFPLVKHRVPHATLVITSDYTLWGTSANNEQYLDLQKMEGVTYLGKVDRKQLVQEQLSSEIMAYPCEYEELFCIAAAECIAAGAVPVTTTYGSLPTTVGKSGVLVRREMGNDFHRTMADIIVEMLTNHQLRKKVSDAGRGRMLHNYNWDTIAQQWIAFFDTVHRDKLEGGDISWMKIQQ